MPIDKLSTESRFLDRSRDTIARAQPRLAQESRESAAIPQRLMDDVYTGKPKRLSLVDKAVGAYVDGMFALDRTHDRLEAHKDRSRTDKLKAAGYAVVYGALVEGWMVGGAIGSLNALEKGPLERSLSKWSGNIHGLSYGFERGIHHAREILATPLKTTR